MINLYNNKHDFYNRKCDIFLRIKNIFLIIYSIHNMIFYKHRLLYLHWSTKTNRKNGFPYYINGKDHLLVITKRKIHVPLLINVV